MKYVLIVVKVLLTLAFVGAGVTKLIGMEDSVMTFEAIGLSQWFRYLAGIVEVGGAVLIWVPAKQAFGAALLVCTMIGAILAHLLVLGPPMVPAIVLGALSAFVLVQYRSQLPGISVGRPADG